jgi:hypothetical protein
MFRMFRQARKELKHFLDLLLGTLQVLVEAGELFFCEMGSARAVAA